MVFCKSSAPPKAPTSLCYGSRIINLMLLKGLKRLSKKALQTIDLEKVC